MKHDLEADIQVVVACIVANPSATQKDIKEQTQLSFMRVRRIMQKLREQGVLVREGSDRKGVWRLIK